MDARKERPGKGGAEKEVVGSAPSESSRRTRNRRDVSRSQHVIARSIFGEIDVAMLKGVLENCRVVMSLDPFNAEKQRSLAP